MRINLTVIILLFSFFFYSNTSRIVISTDTITSTLLPVSLIRGEGFDIKRLFPIMQKTLPSKLDDSGLPYYIINKNGHYFSAFPVFSSLLATPIYLIPVLVKNITPENIEQNTRLLFLLGKISASLFTAISTTLIYLTLTKYLKRSKALLLTILYAFGTTTLSISSQSLWQHAASQMFLSAVIYFLVVGTKKKARLPLCGLFVSLAVLARYSNIVLALMFFCYFLIFERRSLKGFIKYSIPSLIFFSWYQITYPGNLFFYKYEALGQIATFSNSFSEGLLGLLIAPNKGLFIYSPFFIFSIMGATIAIIKKDRIFSFFSVIVLVYICFLAKWSAWHGGWSFGPRMLTDITPFLVILISPIFKTKIWKTTLLRITFALTALFSVFVQLLGATVANFSWYTLQTTFLTQEQAQRAKFLWNWNYPELYFFYLGAGGFFGVLNVFSRFLINISLAMSIPTTIVIFLLIISNTQKKVSKF